PDPPPGVLPRSPGGCSHATDPGVEKRVRDVRGDVDHDEHERHQQHGALHNRIVALQRGVDHQVADTGKCEDLLDDDGSAEQIAALQTEHRHDLHACIWERVPIHHVQLRQTFGTA